MVGRVPRAELGAYVLVLEQCPAAGADAMRSDGSAAVRMAQDDRRSVGLVLPSVTAAAAAALPPARLATGIAVQTTGRQIGSALGVAALVPVLGSGASTAADFTGAWELMIVAAVAAGLTIAGIGRSGRAVAAIRAAPEGPAEAAAESERVLIGSPSPVRSRLFSRS
jgi:hypothetical protein